MNIVQVLDSPMSMLAGGLFIATAAFAVIGLAIAILPIMDRRSATRGVAALGVLALFTGIAGCATFKKDLAACEAKVGIPSMKTAIAEAEQILLTGGGTWQVELTEIAIAGVPLAATELYCVVQAAVDALAQSVSVDGGTSTTGFSAFPKEAKSAAVSRGQAWLAAHPVK